MPTPRLERISQWSYSRWTTYQQCPAKAKYKFIEKRKEPGSAAMDRGSAVHALSEAWVNRTPLTSDITVDGARYKAGPLTKLPAALDTFAKEYAAIRKIKGATAEVNLTFDRSWSAVPWNDWDNAWVRIKVDVLTPPPVLIADVKTGRQRDADYVPQLELYAIGALLYYPQAPEAKTRLWYVDAGVEHPDKPKAGVYLRKDLAKLIKTWERRVEPMLNDAVFAPRPGPYCTYCTFRKNAGGPCKY